MEQKKYNIIYADPPWQYRVYSDKGKGRSAENYYPTMSIEDIGKLPVKELTAEDSVLFMWVTFPVLKEALPVIEEWGFAYKTVAFVWTKLNKKATSLFWGMGIGQEQMRKSVFWQPKAIQSEVLPVSIKLL